MSGNFPTHSIIDSNKCTFDKKILACVTKFLQSYINVPVLPTRDLEHTL